MNRLDRIWKRETLGGQVKEGGTTNDISTFPITGPNGLVEAFHPKAMPVIQATWEERVWLWASNS